MSCFFSVVLGTSLVWLDLRKPRLCLFVIDSQTTMAVLSILIQGEGERVDHSGRRGACGWMSTHFLFQQTLGCHLVPAVGHEPRD